jgi:PKD repeat protein
VLSWGEFKTPHIWDPATEEFTSIPSPINLFCGGHSFLPDGRLLVSGGHLGRDKGFPDNTVFNPSSESWIRSTPMRRGRWYPTNTTLANGEVVIIAGRDQVSERVLEPEIWSPGGVRVLSTAAKAFPYYPRAFLAPNGKLFYAGEQRPSRYLDPSGTGHWERDLAQVLYGNREYGAAVMYDVGKVLYVGGGRTTNTAEIIDLNSATPAWEWTGSMAFPRRHLNATVLPTGEVLATGGTSGPGFNDIATAVHAAELWNPVSGTWTMLAGNAVDRGYHSTSILLPDGRVLHAGSGDGGGQAGIENAELFSPPYLFKGPQPTISDAPTGVEYGASFRISTPEADDIAKVSLIRLGSTTHAFDMNQRFQWLQFTRESGALLIMPIGSRNRTPPGHYLLFILNDDGVPSVARIINVGSTGNPSPPPPPPPPNETPVANFSFSCTGFSCSFTDTSTDDAGVTRWSWEFGDESGTSTVRHPSHTYAAEGSYTVRLTVTDAEDETSTKSASVTVATPPPIVLNVSGRSDATTQYMTLTWSGARGTMVDVYRNGVMIKTTENDGRYVNTRNFTGAASYAYKVCEPGTTTCSNQATVEFGGGAPPPNAAPTANFSFTCNELVCGFTDSSTDGDGTVAAWSWSFGDGTGSTARNPSRTYAAPGIYSVALTATDDDGATGSLSKQVTVSGPGTAISLTATGRADATTQYMTLIWSGAVGAMVDVHRNGVLIKNTENDGRYVNTRPFVGAATYRYKVCQMGTTVCSNEATVVFP